MPSPAALLLAAGGSRRLGHPKQLLEIGGESLLRRTARSAIAAGCAPVIVVLGSQAELMQRELRDLVAEVILNPAWEGGMASSLHCGLAALLSSPLSQHSDNIMVLVCDQPRLTSAVLISLIGTHTRTNADITACSYAGTRGVPAIFRSNVFPALMELSGDEGARRIIAQPRWKVSAVEFAGGEADVDQPADLNFIE